MSSRKERTRIAILDAAWRRLESGEPERLRVEDIAADAGVSRQSVYLHFGSRGGLLVALVDHIDERQGLAALLDEVEAAPTFAEKLRVSLSVTARYAVKVQRLAMALLRMRDTDDDVRAAYDSRMDARRSGLKAIADGLAATGRLRAGWSAQQVVDALWAVGIPPVYDALVAQRGWTVDEYERFLHHLADSLIAPNRAGADPG